MIKKQLQQAKQMIAAGNFDEAYEQIDQVLDWDTENAEAYYLMTLVDLRACSLSDVRKGRIRRNKNFARAVLYSPMLYDFVMSAPSKRNLAPMPAPTPSKKPIALKPSEPITVDTDQPRFCHMCGKSLPQSDAWFCPSCGKPLQPQGVALVNPPSQAQEQLSAGDVFCPKCRSTNLTTTQETETNVSGGGYDLGSGCCGTILLGPIGLLCGMCGSGVKSKSTTRHYWICGKCGHKFRNAEDERAEKRRLYLSLTGGSAAIFIAGCFFAANDISFFWIPSWVYITIGILGALGGGAALFVDYIENKAKG